MTAAVMIQGTGSNVGKSVLVAGLARALTLRGHRVRPFKPQNMSNNAAVTVDGGEIGRAQALQALACGAEPVVDMNPVLLKPETETGAQVVVQGKRLTSVKAKAYAKLKPSLMAPVLESFERLSRQADVVLVEGAGSPAEVNLRAGDIANMGFACAARVPVVLVGDIDRGGVIAQLVGTRAVLDPDDLSQIKAFAINKFRGDPRLFDGGYDRISEETGWTGLGVVPWFGAAAQLPAEDALDIASAAPEGAIHIACPVLSRIANFDDLDPLKVTPGLRVTMVHSGQPLPGDADLVILPGSKSTIGDLAHLRAEGWDIDLKAHLRRGGRILGLCGGYQMLGRSIIDAEGIEGPPGQTEGLGFLDVVTQMRPEKRLTRVEAVHEKTGQVFHGYEIHIGTTDGPDCARPFCQIDDRPDGATDTTGMVQGTYLHGLFSSDAFRNHYLSDFGQPVQSVAYGDLVEKTLNDLAAHLEAHFDIDTLISIARRRTGT
ncbi:MAG: cobyric acid synthase [Pseudomonadota bacterium]